MSKISKFNYAQVFYVGCKEPVIPDDVNTLIGSLFLGWNDQNGSKTTSYETCDLQGTVHPSSIYRVPAIGGEKEKIFLVIISDTKDLSLSFTELLKQHYEINPVFDWQLFNVKSETMAEFTPNLNPSSSIWWNVVDLQPVIKDLWNGYFNNASFQSHITSVETKGHLGTLTLVSKNTQIRTWEVWREGFSATGQEASATFCGMFTGRTFKEACQAYIATLNEEIN